MTYFAKAVVGAASLLCTSATMLVAISPSLAVKSAPRPLVVSSYVILPHAQAEARRICTEAETRLSPDAGMRNAALPNSYWVCHAASANHRNQGASAPV